ncbi:MAG: hypothetical protein EBT83_15305 [Betaproteobacteria bacterium]|nr:hypothetical protein [Betaproteobacteria bacterium]
MPLISPACELLRPNSAASTGSSAAKPEKAVMLSTSAQQMSVMMRAGVVVNCKSLSALVSDRRAVNERA